MSYVAHFTNGPKAGETLQREGYPEYAIRMVKPDQPIIVGEIDPNAAPEFIKLEEIVYYRERHMFISDLVPHVEYRVRD